jgi:Mg-chelatase subunit ChlD
MSKLLLGLLAGTLAVAQSPPVEVMLVLETSPGTEQAIGLIRARAFQQADRAGVVTVNGRAVQVLQTPTGDHDAIDAALQRAGIRVTANVGRVQINGAMTVDLASAIQQACEQLRRGEFEKHRRGVVVLFGSEDPGLSTRLDGVKTALQAADARLYAALVDRGALVPVLTAQLMKELAEGTGGKIYRRGWELKEVVKELRK